MKPQTKRYYEACIKPFVEFLRATGLSLESLAQDAPALDAKVVEYLQTLFEANKSKSVGASLLSGLQDRYPVLKHKMPTAWRVWKAWNYEEPSEFRRPWPLILAMGQAALFFLLDFLVRRIAG